MPRVLLATGRSYPPYQNGGAQLSLHAQALGLQRRGWTVEALTGLSPGPRRFFYRVGHLATLRRKTTTADRLPGYPAHRTLAWHLPAALRDTIDRFRPDAVMVDDLNVLASLPEGVPTVISFVDVEFLRNGPERLPRRGPVRALACSRFVARRVREQFGIECRVAYPIVQLEPAPDAGSPRFVTLINPVQQKGVDVALEVARLLPERQFLFQESWPLSGDRARHLSGGLKGVANVEVGSWTPDVARVYARSRLLLAPSQWYEGFGRVVVEAQRCGVPVIAMDRGGLSEAVGDGGVLLSTEASAQDWAHAVESLLSDEDRYRALSARARENARRPDFDPERIMDEVEAELVAALGEDEARPERAGRPATAPDAADQDGGTVSGPRAAR